MRVFSVEKDRSRDRGTEQRGQPRSQRQGMNVPSVQLSRREQEVLTLITHGDSTKEIAAKLGVSISTVESHRTHMMRKLKLRNVAELVVYAFRVGLIRLPWLHSQQPDQQ